MSLTGDVLGQIGAEVSLNGGVGGSIQFTGEGTDNYDELDNRPSINGVVLTGNKTTTDLHIDTGGTDDYLDLNNKPKINSVTLRGDVSSASLQISYNDLTDRPVIPDLTDLENRMDAVEGDIQAIETDIGDIGDRLIDIASDIATIQATDLVQNSDISSLKSRMNAAETNITNLGSRLTTAEGDISDLQGDVTSLDTIVGNGQQTVGSDLTDAVTQLNSSLDVIGNYYSMGWTATSSNAGNVQLTERKNLPRGTYIAIGSAPVPSVKDFPISLACSGPNSTIPSYNGIRDRSVIAFIVHINDDNADVWLKSESANSCTYSNINQSSIRFMRIN